MTLLCSVNTNNISYVVLILLLNFQAARLGVFKITLIT